MIYDHKDKDTLKKYAVRAFPTFVITDAEGTELMRQVGAPFSTPEEAREWFPKVATALKNVAALEEKHASDAENIDVAIELAETYTTLGKSDKAVEIYKALAPKIKEDDKRYATVQLAYADGLLGTISKENQDEVGKQISGIYDKVLPALIKSGEDRAIDPAVLNARIKMIVNKDNKAARTQMTDMLEPYAKHERILEIKYWAAFFAGQDGDTDTAKTEYAAIVEAGDAENQWVKNAQSQLKKLEKADNEDSQK
ncbi:MAG: hypothetical protein K8I27_07880 [Planctomycetes bacterium]|nr:hypothetical protein [Planctomycetota bacterium]